MTKEACAQIGIGDHVATTGETALRMSQSRKVESIRVLDTIIGPLITMPGACFACVSQLCELCLLIVQACWSLSFLLVVARGILTKTRPP